MKKIILSSLKKICITCYVIAFIVALNGCQPTPEEAPVVSSSKGLPVGVSVEKVRDGTQKEIAYPKVWDEIMERSDGDIKIEANVNIELGNLTNTPVFEFKQKTISDKEVRELCKYFEGDIVVDDSSFLYNPDVYIDVFEIQERKETEKVLGIKDELDLEELTKALDSEFAISKEEATQEAEELLKILNIEGFGIESCVKAIKNIENKGYSITFYRMIGDLLAFEQTMGFYASGNPEITYAPPFYSEKIKVVVTSDGVKSFEWTNMSELTEVIAENVELLPFDDIKENLADHFLYNHVAGLEANDIEKGRLEERYEIVSVQLRASNINAYNEPTCAWVVPVWVFEIERYGSFDDAMEQYQGVIYYMFNAIDGGYIALAQGEGM